MLRCSKLVSLLTGLVSCLSNLMYLTLSSHKVSFPNEISKLLMLLLSCRSNPIRFLRMSSMLVSPMLLASPTPL